MTNTRLITSVEEYISKVRNDRKVWGEDIIAWFRGEPLVEETPLLPKVFRKKSGGQYDENKLLQTFRMKAQSYSADPVPDVRSTDQWLFLAQHVGLPTRLLDWTESALIALYFALQCENPVVWMLDPIGLNCISLSGEQCSEWRKRKAFPLTWLGLPNIKAAWELSHSGDKYPVAVIPTYLHPRMSAQRSAFTIHGADHIPMNQLLPVRLFFKYIIEGDAKRSIRNDLRLLGVNHSTAYPDLDGLAKELAEAY